MKKNIYEEAGNYELARGFSCELESSLKPRRYLQDTAIRDRSGRGRREGEEKTSPFFSFACFHFEQANKQRYEEGKERKREKNGGRQKKSMKTIIFKQALKAFILNVSWQFWWEREREKTIAKERVSSRLGDRK